MKKKIDPEKAKELIEKYRKKFGPSNRKIDSFELPNSVRMKKADILSLFDDGSEELVLIFSIGTAEKTETKEKFEFLNVLATGSNYVQQGTLKTADADPYTEGSCPCPQVPSCCPK
ncbi:hypothetical protein NF867_11210 [Solitalea sp. MAHUQ-68]|uniref:Uncharacterized protein n=1 Tax=Solitalea agri TaxID=2953739 RepID=A0A9X2F809_9SPHI|nr:hypothetical protein [Solitalea agri]MCO4293433.1 hypothetical protein [Solitalea agri]